MKKHLKVVLADDDADDRELFAEVISQQSIEVDTVANGAQLLDYLNGTERDALPHCIFLDLNMPHMGGKECLEKIRATENLKNIPVIIYSTSSNIKDIEDTFSLGANLYFVKESSYVTLKKALATIVGLDWSLYGQNNSLKEFVFNLT